MNFISYSLFELVHSTQRRVLWKARIGAGQSVPIYTVTLDDPLLLRITLRYCRTVGDGLLIHKANLVEEKMADRVQRVLEVNQRQ